MMLQGVPGLIGNSGNGAAVAEAHEPGGSVSGSGGEVGGFNIEEEKGRSEEGERNSGGGGGNRWPRQETLALLKIRSDMDVAFRDSSLKGPLWEEVSRKLAELGFHRSAKKCKEKFENVYKYHKRTKDGRTSKPDGKTYRFFDQLQALDSHPSLSLPPPVKAQPLMAAIPVTAAMLGSSNTPQIVTQVTVPSTANPISVFQNNVTSSLNPAIPPSQPQSQPQPQPPQATTTTVTINPTNPSQRVGVLSYNPNNISMNLESNSISSSSSTSSDEEPERRRKRKRKWKDFFGMMMKEVIQKQEEMQKKFLEALEKRERDRMIREEAWRVQEMAKMNREHDLLVQERANAAAKDAAVIAFLQKISEQQNPENPIVAPQLKQMQTQLHQNPPPPPPSQQQKQPPPQQQQQLSAPPPPTPTLAPVPVPAPAPAPAHQMKIIDASKDANGGENFLSPSPSRWPKTEVQALIKLRTSLDTKYNENGPKGPLWEEISAAMRTLGYNRNAKRCKEKWENINKYYKKVKESNKKRPEDAKTCPYFHQLEELYKEKAKADGSFNQGFGNKPENTMVPIMAQPEQQWPLPQGPQQESATDDHENENDNMDLDNEDYEEGDDEEDDDDGAGYEIVTNKQPSSVATVE